MKRIIILAALLAGPTGALAQAQQVTPNYKVVERGHSLKLTAYGAFDPDCHALGRPTVNLVSPPQGGQVEIEDGFDYPSFANNNVRFKCDRIKGAQTLLYYRASRDFTGQDMFTIEVVFPGGEARQIRWTVYVR